MISDDYEKATLIKVGGDSFEYWYSKESKTAPIMIHKRELS